MDSLRLAHPPRANAKAGMSEDVSVESQRSVNLAAQGSKHELLDGLVAVRQSCRRNDPAVENLSKGRTDDALIPGGLAHGQDGVLGTREVVRGDKVRRLASRVDNEGLISGVVRLLGKTNHVASKFAAASATLPPPVHKDVLTLWRHCTSSENKSTDLTDK